MFLTGKKKHTHTIKDRTEKKETLGYFLDPEILDQLDFWLVDTNLLLNIPLTRTHLHGIPLPFALQRSLPLCLIFKEETHQKFVYTEHPVPLSE